MQHTEECNALAGMTDGECSCTTDKKEILCFWKKIKIKLFPKKMHWYLFSYLGNDILSGRECKANTYTGYKYKYVTKHMIKKNKEYAGVTENAILINCVYLGKMTKKVFTNVRNKKEGTNETIHNKK